MGHVVPVADVGELDPQRHPHRQVLELAPHDVGHHPGPLGQVDDSGDIGHPLVEGREVVLVARSTTCRAWRPAGLFPRHGVGPAAGAEGPGVVVRLPTGRAAHEQESSLGHGVPPRLGEVVGGGEVEAGGRHVSASFVSECRGPARSGVGRRAVLTLAGAIGHAARVPDPTSTWRRSPASDAGHEAVKQKQEDT